MKTQKIQRIELKTFYYVAIHCPFCGNQTYPGDNCESIQIKTCKHLLFMAHDEGFEYRSPSFDQNLRITDITSDDLPKHYGDKWQGYDELTNNVKINDAIKIATYVSAPSFFGSYYGFTPIDDN
jgi:hypothetical protein